jgi:hypothetical protein
VSHPPGSKEIEAMVRRVRNSAERLLIWLTTSGLSPSTTKQLWNPLNGVPWNLLLVSWNQICQRVSILVKTWQKLRTLYIKTYTCMCCCSPVLQGYSGSTSSRRIRCMVGLN